MNHNETGGVSVKPMRHMRKSTRWLWVMVIVVGMMLWACGGSEPAGPTETQPTEETEQDVDTTGETQEETPEEDEGDSLTESELEALFAGSGELNEFHYHMQVEVGNMEPMESWIWVKGERMRTEGEMMGQRMVTIYDTDALYILDLNEKIAMKMPVEMDDDAMDESFTLDDFTSGVESDQMEYLGRDSCGDLMCHLVRAYDMEENYEIRMWLHPEYGIPMRVENITDVAEERYVMKVLELKVGNVSDDQFRIPADFEVMDMGEWMQQLPTVPGS